MPRVCGECIYREPVRRVCLLNLAYQAFVDVDTPANGCTGYHEIERATGDVQEQSECRGVTPIPSMYRALVPGMKP